MTKQAPWTVEGCAVEAEEVGLMGEEGEKKEKKKKSLLNKTAAFREK